MNFYEHHIGDYSEATMHLTFAEDAAYRRMICKYYASEAPLPADIRAIQRLVCARTDEEREAVETVLREFFHLAEDGWRNGRCDAEIARYVAKRDKARSSANARWSHTPTHTERNPNGLPSQSGRNANASDEPCERIETPCDGNALQSPVPSPQIKRARKALKSRIPDDFALTTDLAAYVTETLPDADPEGLFAKFTDQAKAKGWEYANWTAALQTYVRNAKTDSGHFSAGQYPRRTRPGTTPETHRAMR